MIHHLPTTFLNQFKPYSTNSAYYSKTPHHLPPSRDTDHHIHLLPNTAPVNVKPYRYSHYFSRAPGVPEQKMNIGLLGNGAPSQSLHLNSNWPVPGADKYGVQPLSIWLPGGNYGTVHHHENSTNQNLSVPKGWRNGDWICNCGFHNYSSRSQVCLEFYLKMMLSLHYTRVEVFIIFLIQC